MSQIKSKGIKWVLLFLFGLCILAASLTFFILSAKSPYIGVILSKSPQGWVVDEVDDAGLAKSYGIVVGDKPIEINGQSAQIFLAKYDKAGTVWDTLINQLTVIDAQGQAKAVSVAGGSQSAASIIELSTQFFVSLIFWIVGYYVFFEKPKDAAANLLFLCSLALGLVLSANLAGSREIAPAAYFEVAATLISPWLLVHLFLILPEERNWLRGNPRVYLIYLPALVTLTLFPIIGYSNGQPVMWFRSLRLFEYAVGFTTAIGVSVFNYVRVVSVRTRQQLKIVFFGCLAALIPILILIVLPQAIWVQGKAIAPGGFSVLFVVFIPIALGYSIINQKLMDIDLVIRRSVIYGLITLIMAAIVSAGILTTIAFQKSLGRPQEIVISLVLGGIATVLFGPVKNGIEFVVDKYIYKDRYDYRQIIKSLNNLLNSAKDFSDVSRFIVGATVQALNLGGGCLYLKNSDGAFEISASMGLFVDVNNQERLLSLLSKRDRRIEFPNSAMNLDVNLSYLMPLVTGGKEIGILCLSPKNSRQDFSSNDLFLLEGIASVAGVSLHAAILTHDVSSRDTFVSVVSHELRSPLTSVLGYTELLINKDPPEATRKQWLKRIHDNSQKLTFLVDDLLNVTRIQSGKVVMRLEKVKLSDIFEDRIVMAQESTSKHNFVIDIEPSLPTILVDRDKFGEVIGNLLSNAVKYSPDGGTIKLSARHERHNHRVVVSVIDEGIGIGPEDRDLLFTTFHRIQRPETRNIKGSGLGLYIAKEWTKAMGGEIWLESELKKGSTFFVAVPAQDS